MNYLIAESGGTKTDWVLVDAQQRKKNFQTRGLSPSLSDWDSIEECLYEDVQPWVGGAPLARLWFFGAGLGRKPQRERLMEMLSDCLGCDDVVVDTDLMGAAYACLGKDSGVVGILGTGSVAFRYEDRKVVRRMGGWGFLLGDEGGGSSLGRELLRGLLEGTLPPHLRTAYEAFTDQDIIRTLEDLYAYPRPSLYLARQVPFIAEHHQDPAIRRVLHKQLQFYLDHYLFPLLQSKEEEVAFIGGVARIFSENLKELCRANDMKSVKVLTEAPIMPITRFLMSRVERKMPRTGH